MKSKKVNFLVMMNMSILAALAGMIFVARSTASGPSDGVGWELDAIAAVFIGGAAVTGGVGTVVGSIVGGLVMAVLNNGLQLKGIGADATQMIKGLVLLVAVAFDVYNKSQGRASLLGMLTRNFRGRGDDDDSPPRPRRPRPPRPTPVSETHPPVQLSRLTGSSPTRRHPVTGARPRPRRIRAPPGRDERKESTCVPSPRCWASRLWPPLF